MNTVLWIVQGLLAVAFLFAGGSKLTQPRDALARRGMAYVEDFTSSQVKMLGAVEVLGAAGLILPWATGIAPVLTPIAAVGLAVQMAGAAVVHTRRKEYQAIPVNGVLLALAVFVAVGRFAG